MFEKLTGEPLGRVGEGVSAISAPIKNMFRTKVKAYLIGGAILLVGAALSYSLGLTQGLTQGRREVEERYQRKIAEIYPAVPEMNEIFFVSGKIVFIEGKTLTLEETITSTNPLEEPRVREWKVFITDSTELVKRLEKTPEEFAKEEATRGEGETPPLPFKEEKIGLSELMEGGQVAVESKENIKGKAEFEAKKIILQSALAAPAP